MKLRLRTLLLALTVNLLGVGLLPSQAGNGWFDSATPAQPEQVDVRGQITGLKTVEEKSGSEQLGLILIEGEKERDTNYGRAALTITKQTLFFIRRGGQCSKASFAALKLGQQVEAFIAGPVLKSEPVQAAASEVTILESPQ